MGLGMCIIGINEATKTTELERVRENQKIQTFILNRNERRVCTCRIGREEIFFPTIKFHRNHSD